MGTPKNSTMHTKTAYMVIDTGTGNLRVALAAPDGAVLGVARENVLYVKDPAYPESIFFDPGLIWEQIIRLSKKVRQQTPQISIRAVTATSQREGIVLIDRHGRHLIGLPNIDHRGREWEDLISDKDRVYQLTGRYPTSLFSALKLVGVRERLPDLWSQFSTFMSISDWIQFVLSGVRHYEPSQASETLLFDVEKGNWSGELAELFQIPFDILPELRPSGSILGKVQPARASELGIPADAVVIVGGADTQLAVESTNPAVNDVIIVSGTTTPIVKVTNEYQTDPEQRTWSNRHSTKGEFILEANAGVTGLNYQRLKEIFYPNEGYDIIESELAETDHTQCVASLGSLIASEKSPLTQGGFIFDAPVSHRLTRGSFVFATLWDIACSIRENYSILCEVSPHHEAHIWACGGGVQSRTLRQFIASLLNKKILIRNSYRQSSVVGGAFICNSALGEGGRLPETTEMVEPADQAYYTELYEKWKKTRATFKQAYRNE